MGDNNSDEDEGHKVKVFSGSKPDQYEDWQKGIARWCRRRHGAKLGDMFWYNSLPVLDTTIANAIDNAAFDVHVKFVHKTISNREYRRSERLYMDPAF